MFIPTGTSEKSREPWAGEEQGSRQKAGLLLSLFRVWRMGLGRWRTKTPGWGLVLGRAAMENFQRNRGWSREVTRPQWELRILKLYLTDNYSSIHFSLHVLGICRSFCINTNTELRPVCMAHECYTG